MHALENTNKHHVHCFAMIPVTLCIRKHIQTQVLGISVTVYEWKQKMNVPLDLGRLVPHSLTYLLKDTLNII